MKYIISILLFCVVTTLQAAAWADPVPAWSDGDLTTPAIDAPQWDATYEVWYTYINRTIAPNSDVKLIFVKVNHAYGGGAAPTDYKTMPDRYIMGSPSDELHRHQYESQHTVTFGPGTPINNGIWVSEFECKQRFWQTITGTVPANPTTPGADVAKFIGDDLAVNNVNYTDIQNFMTALTTALGGDQARLPSEDEWEYFARANTTTMYSTKTGTVIYGPDYILTDAGAPITNPDDYFNKSNVNTGGWIEQQQVQVNFGVDQNCIAVVEVPMSASITQKAAASSVEATANVEGNFNSNIRDTFTANDYAKLIPIFHYYVVDSTNGGFERVDQYEAGKYRKADGSTFTGTSGLYVKHWSGSDVVYTAFGSVPNRYYAFKAGEKIVAAADLDGEDFAFYAHNDGDLLSQDRHGNKVFVEKYIVDNGIRYDGSGSVDPNGEYIACAGYNNGIHLVRAYYQNSLLGNRVINTTRYSHKLHGEGQNNGGLTINSTDVESKIKSLTLNGSTLSDDMNARLEQAKETAEGIMRNDWTKETDSGNVTITASRYTYALGAYGVFRIQDNSTVDDTGIPLVRNDLPNSWGLYDIHGNIAEICSTDWDGQADYGETLAITPALKIIRGGCWADDSPNCRSAVRRGVNPNQGSIYVGFRLVIE